MVVLGLIVSTLLIFWWNYASQEKAQDTILEQWNAISGRQLTEAYYAYTSKDYRDAISLREFKELLKFIPEPIERDGLKLIEIEDQHPFKVIEGIIGGISPSDLKIYYEMMLQDGVWKIDRLLLLQEE